MAQLAREPDSRARVRRDRQGLPAPSRRPAPPATPGRAHQAVPHRARSTTSAWRRSSRPRRPTPSSSPTRRTSPRRPAATRLARSWFRRTGRARAPWLRACASAVGTTAQVTDIQHQRRIVGSNLTAVELSGLTKVELGFALVLAVAASGVALGAGLPGAPADVRARLGARREGAPAGRLRVGRVAVRDGRRPRARRRRRGASREMLVRVLTGVFDPPPDALVDPVGLPGRGRGAHRRGGRRSPAPRRSARCAAPPSRI